LEFLSPTAEGDYQLVRDWQIANLDLEGDPIYQFPIDIDYGEGRLVTINDEFELRQAYADCREGDDEGGFWETISERLELSRQQLGAILDAQAAFDEAVGLVERQVMASEITREEAAAAVAELEDGFMAQLQEIMTPEQWELFLEIRGDHGRP